LLGWGYAFKPLANTRPAQPQSPKRNPDNATPMMATPMKMNPADLNETTPAEVSHDALRRPLSRAERDALGGDWSADDVIAALNECLQNPAVVASAEQKAMLDLAACIQIQEALESHLLDAESGAIPEFVRQTERAVEYFDKQLM